MTKRRGKYTDDQEAEAAAEHELELAEDRARRPTEGDPTDDQIVTACSEARRIASLCELLGFDGRAARMVEALMRGAHAGGLTMSQLIEDPNERPYIWEE